jgi:hypothetical protein
MAYNRARRRILEPGHEWLKHAMPYADLEIGLHRHDAERYIVDMRYTSPDSADDKRLPAGKPALASFDHADLRAKLLDPAAYGRALSAQLFAEQEVRDLFVSARP